TSAEPSAHPADGQTVTYAGVTVTVPASWPVIDLEADPAACVRLDVHAVYLGTPGTQADCPPTRVGRTDTVHLQGRPAELPFGATTLELGGAHELTTSQVTSGEAVVVPRGSSVVLTVTIGSSSVAT